jgi:hypothetical protein
MMPIASCYPQQANIVGNAFFQSIINSAVYFPLLNKMNSAMMIFNSKGESILRIFIIER